jgi:predicted nucleotidyltransferase
MSAATHLEALELPVQVKQILDEFLRAAEKAFAPDLHSVILYGSAAEGMMRATSDVNVILVLSAFQQDKADQLREPLRAAQAAIQLRPMFLLKSEIDSASRAFAQKFADILRRHRVLLGEDPFAGISVSRECKIFQLQQQLLNLILRLRALYVSRGLREEQLALVIADAAGPLTSCAAALLELEGQRSDLPKGALERVVGLLGLPSGQTTLSVLSKARERRAVSPGEAPRVLFQLTELAQLMHARAVALT